MGGAFCNVTDSNNHERRADRWSLFGADVGYDVTKHGRETGGGQTSNDVA